MKEAANRGGLANLKAITPSIRRQFDRPSTAKIGESCVLMALSDRLVLSWPACAPYRPHDPDQQDRADEPGDQVADPSSQVDPKEAQDRAGNGCSDDTEHDIHQDP